MSIFGALVANGTELTAITCGSCGVVHAIPKVKYDAAFEEGGFWTCPNGHSRGFAKGRRESEAVVRERDRLKQENARLAEEAAAAERKVQRTEKKLKMHQTRSAAGVCPCCNRTFAKVAAHMKSKHPEFGQTNVVPLTAVKT